MIGVNCLALNNGFECGAKEVLLNLCHAWEELGLSKNIIFFAFKGQVSDQIKAICPSATVVEVEETKYSSTKIINVTMVQTAIFHKMYRKYQLDAILFVMSGVGLMGYNVPVAVIPHDIQPVSHPENFLSKYPNLELSCNKWFYRNDFRKVSKIIAISDYDKSEISEFFPKFSDKIHRIYDPIRFDTSKTICATKDKSIIATNIQYEHKNIITLIKAFEIFAANHDDYKLYLIGRKSDYVNNKLVPYVNEHGLSEKVVFTGFISREELEQKWRNAAVYVNPSKYEGFGMTAVESVLMGAPTVLASLPVNIEVTENMCNYYGDATDYKSLANCLEATISESLSFDELQRRRDVLLEKYLYLNIGKKYWDTITNM